MPRFVCIRMRFAYFIKGIGLLVVILGLPSALFARPILFDDPEGNFVFSAADVQILTDADGRMTFEEVRGQKFEPTDRLSFGYSESVHWARFELRNESGEKHLLLEITYPVIDKLELYMVDDSGRLLHKTQGDSLPFDQRDLHHRNFVFDLPIRSGSTAEVYLRVDTESATSLPMRIWTRDSFTEKDHL
ncbi:MAG: hypothetical protein KDK34_04535, partial [Leptospiraceae bacterium]|nr:hypothetical protein [Leptospiraceae bacterium]